jgi:hypothetical protein
VGEELPGIGYGHCKEIRVMTEDKKIIVGSKLVFPNGKSLTVEHISFEFNPYEDAWVTEFVCFDSDGDDILRDGKQMAAYAEIAEIIQS